MLWNIDPWHELERVRTQLDDVFGGLGRTITSRSFPLVNVYDAGDSIVVAAELPGMNKDKVNITYNDGMLTLSGTREPLPEAKKMEPVRQERPTGAFEKTINIPVKVIADKIMAVFRDGVLSVTLPKAEEAKPRKIQIQVG